MSDPSGAPGRRAARWLERLLRLYPSEYRTRFGEGMKEMLREQLADAGRQRRLAVALFWVRSFRDAAFIGLVERIRPRRGGVARVRASVAADLWQDLRFALRTLARRPRFSAGSALVLGLGIGSATTVFTLVDRIYFERPAEVAEPDRLVRVWRAWETGVVGGSLSHPDYRYYRDGASTLSGLAAYDGSVPTAYSLSSGDAGQLDAWFVSADYFEVLGVSPAMGRSFLPEEDATPGSHPVVVVSHAFWRDALGGGRDVVGTSLALNGHAFTVVGVAPERFRGSSPVEDRADVWIPIAMYETLTRVGHMAWWDRDPNFTSNWLSVVGRLAPGVTLEAARSELRALSDALRYEGRDPTEEHVVVSSQYLYTPRQASVLGGLSRMLLAVIVIVLAITAANSSVLMLSRATTRAREMGIRRAVGAGRARILRLLLAESLLLGLAGGAIGVALAFAAGDLVAALLPFPFGASFTPGAGVMATTTLLSLLTGAGVGLVPALHSARIEKPLAPGASGARRTGGRLRDVLVVAQVALSLVLVAGAGLFARSFLAARGEPIGFDTRDRLVISVNLRSQGYDEAGARAFLEDGLERLRALPGVVRASATVMVPFRGEWSTTMPTPPGARATEPDGRTTTGVNLVAPEYFEAAGIPVVRGRPLGPEDRLDTTPAVVINETLARTLWPNEDPLGRTLPLRDRVDYAVVGVVRDATYYELGEEPERLAYGSMLQVPALDFSFLVQTSGDALELAPAARDALREIDGNLTIRLVSTLKGLLEQQTARYEVTAVLVGVFSALALLLAASGLYGVVSFVVAQRTREIGVRIALGANRMRIARQVLSGAFRLSALGVVLGLALAVTLGRFVGSLLYGVEPGDPWALLGASVALVGVTLLASLAPARRASRVDPLEAIQAE